MCNNFNKKFLDEASRHWGDSEPSENSDDMGFMKKAVDLALKGVLNNEGGPFGCVIVHKGKIIGRGNNKVTSENDPTAHAEILAIREACAHLGSHQLDGCTLYTSCEPCPMCLGAIYWARPEKIYFAGSKKDAARSGFDDDFIYQEILLPPEGRSIEFRQIGRQEALKAFEAWDEKEDKIEY
jgi:tRNA(Arg) A34 adenosine deaminase TadA